MWLPYACLCFSIASERVVVSALLARFGLNTRHFDTTARLQTSSSVEPWDRSLRLGGESQRAAKRRLRRKPVGPDTPSKITRLAKLGFKLESPEEYLARRERTVALYGGCVKTPESPSQYLSRRAKNEKAKEERRLRSERYDALVGGPLPGKALSDVKNGDVLDGILLSELPRAARGAKAWFDVGVWRRRKDGLPTRVSALVRLTQEDVNELRYFQNNKDRKMRLYLTDVQHISGRLVASFSPPGVPRAGRRNGGCGGRFLSDELRPGQMLLDELREGTSLQGVVQQMTSHAAWIEVPVFRRSLKDGFLRPLCARLHGRDLDPTTCLASTVVRNEAVSNVVRRGEELTIYVKQVFPASGKFDVVLNPSQVGPSKGAASRRRKNRQQTRRSRSAKALFVAAGDARALAAGVERCGAVVRVEDYGLLVDVGAAVNGLVHISDLARASWRGKPAALNKFGDQGKALVGDIKRLVPVGQRLKVRLLPLRPPEVKGRRLALNFEVSGWLGTIPVEPGYEGESETGGIEDDNELDGGEYEEDEQDRWESKFGMDSEYY